MGYGGHCSALSDPRRSGEAQLMDLYPIVQWPALSSGQGFCRPSYLIVPDFDPATDICTPVRTVKYPQQYSVYLNFVLINGTTLLPSTVSLDPAGQQIIPRDLFAPYYVSERVGVLAYDGKGHWIGTVTPPVGGSISIDAVLGSCIPSSRLLLTYNGIYKATGTGYGSVAALTVDELWLGETWYDGTNSWGGDLAVDCPLTTHPKIYQGAPNQYTVVGGAWNVTMTGNPSATTPITKTSSAYPMEWRSATYPTLGVGEKGFAGYTGSTLDLVIGTAAGNKTGHYAALQGVDPFGPTVYTATGTIIPELPSTVTVSPVLSIYA